MMNINFRKAILAGAIAAVISAPAFAAQDGQNNGSSDGANNSGMNMSMDGQPATGQSTTGDSMNKQQNMNQNSMGMQTRNQMFSSPIYSRSAKSLDGVEIVGMKGEDIGTIKSIVRTKDSRSAFAVVSTGGMLGVGTREVLVSLDELNTAADEKLQMNITQERLEARNEYKEDQYVELKGEKPIGGSISEFSAFETDGQTNDSAQDPVMAPESTQ